MSHSRIAYAFRSLSVRNFRLFAGGQVVSAAGTWMMVVAQDWLVLGLTDGSGTALGVVTALQFAPLLFTLYGGRLADRHDKRMLLTAANLASGALALVLAVLALAGSVQLWHIWLCALGLGVVNAVEIPTRMAFVSELVGPELLPNASALSGAYFNIARVAGPALAGLLITLLGTGWVMVVNAASYLATVAGLRMMRPGELLRGARAAGPVKVSDGLRYVRDRPDLSMPVLLVGAIGLFSLNFQLLLPLLAKTVFDAGVNSFGLMTTAYAGGALLSALVTTSRRGRPAARTVILAALGLGVAEIAAGLAPNFGSALVLLFVTGFAALYFAQAANHRIQLGSDPAYRGRVMALYTLILQGSTPLGSLLVGALAEHAGARSGLFLGGFASVAAALVAAAAAARSVRNRSDGLAGAADAAGVEGVEGPAGATGVTGATGPTGSTGPTGPGGGWAHKSARRP
ncbi:MFS transporter [Streptomyces sp. NPDC060031]|uniref:MFS transporter n=1 Tax=Streptomyces sp. NPDC060031 TaxID=3347043 RepID=UPI0036936DBE